MSCNCGHPASGSACKHGFAKNSPVMRNDINHEDDTWPTDRCVVCGHLEHCHLADTIDEYEEDECRDDSPYCDCGSFPDEEEQASNRCSCCGKMVAP